MRRRAFLGVIVAALAVLFVVRARQRTKPVVAAPVREAAPVSERAEPSNPSFAASDAVVVGTVKSAQNAKIAGARVCAVDVNGPHAGDRRDFCADTGSDGTYALVGLPVRAFFIRASARGFAPGVANEGRPVRINPGETLHGIDIVLEAGGANVVGAVADQMGGPVPHAIVRVARSPQPGDVCDVEADDLGRFEASISEGRVSVTASSPGYATGQIYTDAPAQGLTIVLLPGSSVSGHVVSAVDGQPVPGVTVQARHVGAPAPGEPASVSQADGAFDLRGLAPGTYALTAEGPRWSGGAAAPIEVGLLASIQDVTVRVQPAARVLGRVLLQSTGEPCVRGRVGLFPPPGARRLEAAIGPDGRVEFQGVAPGHYGVAVECVGNLLRQGPGDLDVGNDDVADVVWKVGPGLGFAVRVVDGADRRVPGAQVQMEMPSKSGSSYFTGFSVDANGRYEHPTTLQEGTYRLSPSGAYRGQPVTVDLHEGMRKAEVTLRLDGKGSILVRVQTRGGDPVDNVVVAARADAPPPAPGSVTSAAPSPPALPAGPPGGQGGVGFTGLGSAPGYTGAGIGGGEYRIGPVPAGTYVIQVDDNAGGPALADGARKPEGTRVEVADGVARATVVLDRGGKIRGRVVDGARQPMPDVWVSAVRDSGDAGVQVATLGAQGSAAGARVLTDVEGRFVLTNLPSGQHFMVRAEQPGASDAVEGATADGADVTLTLLGVGKLSGTAVDSRGRAVTSFRLQTQQLETKQTKNVAVTDASGNWSMDQVPVGRVRVAAMDGDGHVAFREVDVIAGQTVDGVRLQFQAPP